MQNNSSGTLALLYQLILNKIMMYGNIFCLFAKLRQQRISAAQQHQFKSIIL